MWNFIVNGRSGLGRGLANTKKIMDYCYSRGIEYTLHITGGPGHATQIAKQLSHSYPQHTLVAVGGDGTFHEVLNGIENPKEISLGLIPSGRGNDFARAAKLSLDPIEALKDIERGETAYIDYIRVGDKRCLNVAGTGLDIDVLERVAGREAKLTYLLSLVYCLKHFEPYKVKVTIDGKTDAYDCIMVGVCNGIAIGGNIRLSPLSQIDDGKLDVIVMQMPKDGKIMRVLPKFVKGKHMHLPITTHYRCESVQVESPSGKPIQLDGEIYRDRPLNCEIMAGGLKSFRVGGKT